MRADPDLAFTSQSARLQYHLLMMLFRLAFNRWLFGIFTRSLARLFDPSNAVLVTLPTGTPFKIYLNDGYWTRFALFRRNYEPEVGAILQAAAGHAHVFYDAGANKGYWSVFASTLFQQIIAIEASSTTYEVLSENTEALRNVSRHQAAVYSRSHEKLTFVNVHNSHASARLGKEASNADQTEKVETVAIDDLIAPEQKALIKLDVEGAEIAAIDGANRALSGGAVLIYEDHGNDPSCAPSAHLLANPEIRLYFGENPSKPLTSIDEVRAVKTDPFKGYNFIAARADSTLLDAILEVFAIR